jgi:two-component system, OmpR family, sensor histidine kinase BaeS
LARLLASSVLVAVCSVAATAWLAVQSTAKAIQQEQGQSISDDTRVYDTLVAYAATHPRWDGVEQVVRDLAEQTGHEITLTAQDHREIAGSAAGTPSLPPKASAVVDPLNVDPALIANPAADRIDRRVTGPFLIPPAERDILREKAKKSIECLREFGVNTQAVESPTGRPTITITGSESSVRSKLTLNCSIPVLEQPTATERKALTELETPVNDCLKRQGVGPVTLALDFSWSDRKGPRGQVNESAVRACVDAGRREQLRAFVAPAALLYINSPGRATNPHFDLSGANTMRVVGVTALILALTVAVTVVVGVRLVRPLRALTAAAQHPTEQHVRVPVTSNDEIGNLAAAFNDLSERREIVERQRKSMVSDVAHELGTPLTNIRSWLEAAQDGLVPTDPELLSLLLEEASLLQHVIDDLRDLADADAGNLRLHRELMFVNDLLDQVAAAHRGPADAAGVRLEVRTHGDPELFIDPVRLRQAVGNLVSNAIRHTPAGGSVTIRSQLVRGALAIEVADTGSGIEPADLSHVFDRFWRAEKSRNRHTGGSGLGLAIVRKLAEAHGGTVNAASVPGQWTVFTLRLPAHSAVPVTS